MKQKCLLVLSLQFAIGLAIADAPHQTLPRTISRTVDLYQYDGIEYKMRQTGGGFTAITYYVYRWGTVSASDISILNGTLAITNKLWQGTEYHDPGVGWPKEYHNATYWAVSIGSFSNSRISQLALVDVGEGNRSAYGDGLGYAITNICPNAFMNCGALSNVMLVASIPSLPRGVFANCSNLVTVCHWCTSIGESAFENCVSLESGGIASGVIGRYAFRGCTSLKSADISRVTSISGDAFDNTPKLMTVYAGAIPPENVAGSKLLAQHPTNMVFTAGYNEAWSNVVEECSQDLFVTITPTTNEVVEIGKSRTIMMSCEDEKARIFYTTDGSEPTTSSAEYMGKFKLRMDGKTTIKAIAVVEGWPVASHIVKSVAFAGGKCEMPAASMEDGSKFYFRNQSVTLTANTDGCVIRYTLDGTEPTEASTVYESPIVISETTTIKAKAFRDDYFESDVMSVTLVRGRYQVATPCVVAYYGEIAAGNERTTFEGSHVKVVMTNATEGSEIHYTLDGSIPTSDSPIYDAPLKVFTNLTIRAVAIKDDWQDSEVGELKLVKETGIGDVMKDADMAFVNDASYPWTVDSLVFCSGTSSMRSGGTGDNGASTLLTTVTGAGRVLFRWKAACESDVYDHEFDHGEFRVDGTEAANRIDGESEWRAEDVRIDGEGPHTLAWVYQKDDCDEKGYSGGNIWVDNFVWIPDDGSKVTYRSETEVPYNWLYRYGLLKESVPEVAVFNVTGKRDADGRMLTTEADYIAGTDPTNAMSQLKAFVDLSEGYPKVTWDPDLNEDGTKALRTYKVWGKEALDDGATWAWPTNALHRFFKVTVEVP